LLILILSAAIAGPAWGVERFPPPDFSAHQLPPTTTPPARTLGLEYLDVAALAAGLGLASYLALVRRSRKGLVVLAAGSLAWLGFWRSGCVCPIGAIQNVALSMADGRYAVPFSVVLFFVLPLLVTLFFGRTFCAAVCPLGAVQELTAVRPVRVPPWLDHALGLIRWVYLGAAVLLAATGTAFLICQYDPFVGFFRRSTSAMTVVGLCLLVVGLFVARPYCRYLCPYGAILGVLARVAKWHVRIPPGECINCRLCEDSCPYGAIRVPTVPPDSAELARGRRRLLVLLLMFPGLVGLGSLAGRGLSIPLSRLHVDVRLAERLRWEETGRVSDTVDATNAFRNTGRPAAELYWEVNRLRERFVSAGGWLGAWVGLVVGAKLIALSIRRRRTDYRPDPGRCVSCGRCFWYCPQEQVRLGLIPPVAGGGQPAAGSEEPSGALGNSIGPR
jgi:ferredoxin